MHSTRLIFIKLTVILTTNLESNLRNTEISMKFLTNKELKITEEDLTKNKLQKFLIIFKDVCSISDPLLYKLQGKSSLAYTCSVELHSYNS